MTGSPYAALMISSVVYAMGAGFLEVIISPTIESLPSTGKSASMSILHSFYCWGQAGVVLLSTLFLLAFGNTVWYVLPLVWSLLPLCNLFVFLRVPLVPPLPPEKTATLRQLLSSRTILLAFAVMVGAGASELAMSQWASMLAERGLGLSKAWGDVLGPCLFAVLMGTTRVLGPLLYRRFQLADVLLFASAFCIFCYALTVFSTSPGLSLAGCAMTGAAVALMWPATISLAAGRYSKRRYAYVCSARGFWRHRMFARAVVDRSLSPIWCRRMGRQWRVQRGGTYGEQAGLKSGLAAAGIFPVLMIVCLLLLREKRAGSAR